VYLKVFFLSFIKNNSTTFEDNELYKFAETNKLIQELVAYMDSFCVSYNITLSVKLSHIDILIDTFINSIVILYKHIENQTGWALSSLKDYISTVRKILEFLSYIINLNDEYLNEFYINSYDKNKEKNYYSFLAKLSNSKDYNFKIIDGKILSDAKNNRKYLLLKKYNKDEKVDAKYVYRPVGNHSLIAPTDKSQNHIEYYFKTKDIEENNVWRIFNLSRSKGNDRKSKGGFRGKSIALETYEIINYIANENLDIKNIDARETRNELSQMIEKEVLSPLLSEKTAKDVNENFFKTVKTANVESNYKQFLINKAISNSYINKNLTFRNDNTKPSLPKLKKFLIFLTETAKEDIFIDILIFSLILGFSIEKIIYSILGFDKDLVYIKKKNSVSLLHLNIHKDLFSDFEDMKKNNISLKTIKNGEIYFTEKFERKWLYIKNKLESYIIKEMTNANSDENIFELSKIYYKDNIHFEIELLEKYANKCFELNNFDEIKKYIDKNFQQKFISQIEELNFTEYYINKWLSEKKDLLDKYKDKYTKSINLNFQNIGSMFLYYYRVYNPMKSDFTILFTQNISKNDEAKLTYAVVPKRFIIYENWIYKLTLHLGLDKHFNNGASNYIPQNINYEKEVGSNNFIPPIIFKNFINELNKLSFDDEIICLNICMIYLRYIFSIQLVSRDIIESSVNLSQISRRFNIVTIQEKSESVMAGKKILPLSQSTIMNIELFYKLKKQYNIDSYYPVLIQSSNEKEYEIPATRKNIFNFFDSLNKKSQNSISSTILKFTQYTKLNFGRHIITSELIEKGIAQSYIDACMNHYSLGKEDQGIYSLFKNQDYDKTIKDTIEEIENEYIPFKLSVKDFLWNLKI